MKYFYQQLFGFVTVVVITISVCGGLFFNFMSTHIYRQREQQLYNYAKWILNREDAMTHLEDSIAFLRTEHVQVAIYNINDEMVYPHADAKLHSGVTTEKLEQLRNGSAVSLSEVTHNFTGEEMGLIVVYYPLFENQQYNGYIAVGTPLSRLKTEIEELRTSIFIAFIVATIVGSLISFFFAQYQTRRINRLRNATHEISEGNFNISIPNQHQDEFDQLAADFNKMAASLQESEKEIERQENLRRQFMMDVAHEMRTPLTTMHGLLEGMMHNMISESRRERSMELISNETQRLIRLVNENLDYEKIRSDQIVLVKRVFDGCEAMRNVADQLSDMAASKNNVIRLDCPPDFKVYADYDRFIQIIVNIVKNAIQFTDNGEIQLKGWRTELASVISIRDSGMGISTKELDAIWERFYKTDVSRKSSKYGESGIGLAIVKSLITSHNGTIAVESEVGKGTTFTISFPHQK